MLTLTPQCRILYSDARLRPAAELLASDWQLRTGWAVTATQGTKPTAGTMPEGDPFNPDNPGPVNPTDPDDLYVRFTTADGQVFNFCVEYYLTNENSDVYKAVEGLQIGDVVDVEGYLYWYEGPNTHITAVTKAQ